MKWFGKRNPENPLAIPHGFIVGLTFLVSGGK